MAEANERIMTDDTGKEIIEALKNIPGVVGATPISRGGTGATTAEEALRNLGAQPLINADVEKELSEMVKSVNSIIPDDSGNINIVHVRTAENLTSDDAQDIYGEFIERTTGGTASLTDGKSWIGVMEGKSIRTGYVPEQKSVQVTNMPRTPITATIDWYEFRIAVNFASSNIIFSYDGTNWNIDPSEYGITVSGYPIAGDTVSVSFTAKSETYNVITDSGITVQMNWSVYEAAYETSPVTFFSYASGAWNVNLNDYGITVVGNPTDGDVINIFYSPEVRSIYVNPAARGEELSAYVNWDTFKMAVSGADSIVNLVYTTSWSESLTDYGVSISGSPIKGDQITLYFTNEVRGQIISATPTRMISTGWNLYDDSTGYARVLKYHETYGFVIEGTYSSIVFAETPNGDTTPISVDSNGHFQIPSDGYILVTGGNAVDTEIYMTWSDWIEGTPMEFEEYYESVIELGALMQATFPYGLCSVGSTTDTIDFSNKIATSYIERIEYSASNLAIVQASGRDYSYDEDYIYAVKETPTSVGFSISYELDAFDHGLERIEGTTVPVAIHMLYGQNLRDKLRTDVVTISQQTLTSAQKQQIRTNLGLGGNAELPVLNGGTGATDAPGARTNLGLGSAAVKNVAASISNTDTGLPTAALVSQSISAVNDNLSGLINEQYEVNTFSNIPANSYTTYTIQRQYKTGYHILSMYWVIPESYYTYVFVKSVSANEIVFVVKNLNTTTAISPSISFYIRYNKTFEE